MERKELLKSSYNLFRTRIDIPGSEGHWEVATIDVKKLNERLPEEPVAKPTACLYETMVYKTADESDDPANVIEIRSRLKDETPETQEDPLFYLQTYSTREEAQFGHEEVVHSILSGLFFIQDDDGLSDYLLNPDSGDDIEDDEFFPITDFNDEDSEGENH